jgi:hypothetical protein
MPIKFGILDIVLGPRRAELATPHVSYAVLCVWCVVCGALCLVLCVVVFSVLNS